MSIYAQLGIIASTEQKTQSGFSAYWDQSCFFNISRKSCSFRINSIKRKSFRSNCTGLIDDTHSSGRRVIKPLLAILFTSVSLIEIIIPIPHQKLSDGVLHPGLMVNRMKQPLPMKKVHQFLQRRHEILLAGAGL